MLHNVPHVDDGGIIYSTTDQTYLKRLQTL